MSTTIPCPGCQTLNTLGAKFCKKCGGSLGAGKTPQPGGERRCAKGHVFEPHWEVCAWCAGPPVDNASAGKTAPQEKPTPENGVRRKTIKEQVTPQPDNTDPQPHTTKEESTGTVTREFPTPPERKKTQVIRKSNEQPAKNAENKPHLVGWLVNYTQDKAGVAYELREGRYIIGSGSRASIVIPDENSISGEHAILLYRNGRLRFQDNLSTNGSFINGEEVDDKIDLHHGDRVRLGNTELIVTLVPNG